MIKLNCIGYRTARQALIGMALLLGAAGCMENRLTMANYETLKAGMSRAEVEQVLGKADTCSGAVGIANCRWGNERRFIQAQFVGDRAMTYQYQGLE